MLSLAVRNMSFTRLLGKLPIAKLACDTVVHLLSMGRQLCSSLGTHASSTTTFRAAASIGLHCLSEHERLRFPFGHWLSPEGSVFFGFCLCFLAIWFVVFLLIFHFFQTFWCSSSFRVEGLPFIDENFFADFWMLCEGRCVEFSTASWTWYSSSVIGRWNLTKWIWIRIGIHGCLFVNVSAPEMWLLWLRFGDGARSYASFWRVSNSCWPTLLTKCTGFIVVILLLMVLIAISSSIRVLHGRLLPAVLLVAITDIPAQHWRPLLRLVWAFLLRNFQTLPVIDWVLLELASWITIWGWDIRLECTSVVWLFILRGRAISWECGRVHRIHVWVVQGVCLTCRRRHHGWFMRLLIHVVGSTIGIFVVSAHVIHALVLAVASESRRIRSLPVGRLRVAYAFPRSKIVHLVFEELQAISCLLYILFWIGSTSHVSSLIMISRMI